MEVVGALASISQLAVYLSTTIASVHEIRNELRDAPRRIRQQDKYLLSLLSILETISDNPSLQTAKVAAYLEPVSVQITFIRDIITSHSAYTRSGLAKKLWWSFISVKEQPRVLESFKTLEFEKSSLHLYITGSYGQKLHDIHSTIDKNMPRSAQNPQKGNISSH